MYVCIVYGPALDICMLLFTGPVLYVCYELWAPPFVYVIGYETRSLYILWVIDSVLDVC